MRRVLESTTDWHRLTDAEGLFCKLRLEERTWVIILSLPANVQRKGAF
jgi:hypothetical protein